MIGIQVGAQAWTARACRCEDSLQSLIMALPCSVQDQVTLTAPPPNLQVMSTCQCQASLAPSGNSQPQLNLESCCLGTAAHARCLKGGGAGAPSGDHARRRKNVGRLSSWNSMGRAEAAGPSSAAFSLPAPCRAQSGYC